MQQMWIHVGLGEYNCGSYTGCDDVVKPGPPRTCTPASGTPPIDCKRNGNSPPVKIIVDYGDGSGESTWERENVQNVWTHTYSLPGIYTIYVMSMNLYAISLEFRYSNRIYFTFPTYICLYTCSDILLFYAATHEYTMNRQHESIRVAVIEPVVPVNQSAAADNTITDYERMEIWCPDLVLPGTYFNCTVDVPKGQGLSAVITLKDDLTNENISSTVKIPGKQKLSPTYIHHMHPNNPIHI